jgi:3-methyladenine DNA glycosylase/8-oxoguanine DNA glycosylase
VLVRAAQLSRDRVLFGAQASTEELAHWGIARMRRALGIDQDLREFHERFRFDPLIGISVRNNPDLRARGKPDPFEALCWAICEQLIEFERAAAIQRRLVWRLGRSCPVSGLRDAPPASIVGAQAPALFASFDLSESRAITLVRAAREVAAGRVDLDGPDLECGWRRLRQIRGIGSWTLQGRPRTRWWSCSHRTRRGLVWPGCTRSERREGPQRCCRRSSSVSQGA